MTHEEFTEQYDRLKSVHRLHFSSAEKAKTIFSYVSELDASWFRRIVDTIVMSINPNQEKYDIGYAAIAEKRARKSAQFADDICAASKAFSGITDDGLKSVLEKYGSNSLSEAIEKSKKGEFE